MRGKPRGEIKILQKNQKMLVKIRLPHQIRKRNLILIAAEGKGEVINLSFRSERVDS